MATYIDLPHISIVWTKTSQHLGYVIGAPSTQVSTPRPHNAAIFVLHSTEPARFMMADEVALGLSQVTKDRRRQLVRHKTISSHRPSPPLSIPRRLSSVTPKLGRRPLSTINEDRAPSLKSDSSDSLKLIPALPHQPSTWTYSSEHLIYISPSRQLQEFQSVSYGSVDEENKVDKAYYWSTPRVYRTQSQWTTPSDYYVPSGTPETQEPTTVETSAASVLDIEDLPESAEHPVPIDCGLSRDAIADLFHRVEEYEREHSDDTQDAGTIWVRVSEAGQGLTKTLKTMGSLRRRPTFEVRLEMGLADRPKTPSGTVSTQPQVKIYEKPTRMKRLSITVGDCWKRFRNRSGDTGTELQASHNVVDAPVMNGSIFSFSLDENPTTRPQIDRKDPLLAPDLARKSGGTIPRPVRKDSKRSVSEQLRRRKSSLFLDVD